MHTCVHDIHTAVAYYMMIGTYMYNARGIMMNSDDKFKITIHGKGTLEIEMISTVLPLM